MKKKVLAMTFAALMLFTTTVSAGSEAKTIEVEDSDINISVNLSEFEEDVFVYNDTLYAPLLKTVEAMGGTYDLNSKNDSLAVSSAPINTYELLAVDGSTLTNEVKYACNTMMSDMVMLLTYSSCLPKFYVFIDDVQHIKELADLNLYKEAQKSFNDCVFLLIELKNNMAEAEDTFYDSISEHSELMHDAYRKIIQAALYESTNVINNLAEYVNFKQTDERTSAAERKLKKGCDTILNLQAMVEHIDVRIPVSYLHAYSNNNKEIKELSNAIIANLKEDFIGINWYKEYKNLKDGFDFPFDDPDKIPSVIVYEKEPASDSEEITVDDAPTIETTTPINTAVAFMKVPEEDIYDDGAYKVGVDIPAGEYIIIPNIATSTYFRVSNSDNDILANGFSDSSYYITVENGQYFMIDDGFAIPASKYNVAVYDYSKIYPGMYKVGTDIPVGEYKFTTMEDNGYYCLYDNSTTNRRIVSNDYFGKSSYANAKLGDYLLVDCIASYIAPN